jgi:hypothetical protein
MDLARPPRPGALWPSPHSCRIVCLPKWQHHDSLPDTFLSYYEMVV